MPKRPAPDDLTVLIEAPHSTGRAAVCRHRDTGELWLTAALDGGGFTDIEDFDWEWEEHEGMEVWGGAAPSGARAAEIRDVGGDIRSVSTERGAWLYVPDVDVEVLSVLFRGADGEIVPTPGPRNARSEPLAGAEEECPACGGQAWEVVTDPAHSGQLITCGRCGWRAARYHDAPDLPDLDEIEIPETVRRLGKAVGKFATGGLRRLESHMIRSIDFDVYGLGTAWTGPRSRLGYSAAPIRIEVVQLHHGEPGPDWGSSVLVETRREADDERLRPEDLASSTLEDFLEHVHPERQRQGEPHSPAEHLREVLEDNASEAELHRRVNAATGGTAAIRVDGEPLQFLTLSAEGVTVGAAAHGDLDLTVASTGPALTDLDLVVIDDLSEYDGAGPR